MLDPAKKWILRGASKETSVGTGCTTEYNSRRWYDDKNIFRELDSLITKGFKYTDVYACKNELDDLSQRNHF
jgi:hypothetical protein